MFKATRRHIRQFFHDLREYREAELANQAAIFGALQALKAERSDQLERIATAVEFLVRVEQSHLNRTGHSV